MRAYTHISTVASEVRGQQLNRHFAKVFDRGRTLLVATGLGVPRLWAYASDAVLEGADAFLETSEAVGTPRLEGAVQSARELLTRRADALIERVPPNADLVIVHLDRGKAHVATVGSGRVYVYRRGSPSRLTPREAPLGGLLSGTLNVSETSINSDDLVLAGSSSAFSVHAVARLASVLNDDPSTKPSVVTSLLVEPADEAGVGAAAVAMRVI